MRPLLTRRCPGAFPRPPDGRCRIAGDVDDEIDSRAANEIQAVLGNRNIMLNGILKSRGRAILVRDPNDFNSREMSEELK